MSVQYYGRSTDDGTEFQPLITHLNEVSKYMGDFCGKFTIREIGEICGELHDIGKYSDDFQKRIRGENIRTDHSSGGAKLLFEHAKSEPIPSALAYYLLSYVIAGHHSGLPNMGNANAEGLYQRLENSNPDLFSAWKSEVSEKFPDLSKFLDGRTYSNQKDAGFSLFLYTHFLFSSLIDADRTSAQNFPVRVSKPAYPSLSEMKNLLDDYMDELSRGKSGELNKIRSEILSECRKSADSRTGMFTLTVPTGGGKTLSSLSFALNHALKNNMDRVIYTIPFTSIIEQNAGVYKKIFGNDNVLEHHSNFILPDNYQKNRDFDSPYGENRKLSYAVSNWDAPLILTTNVQFFESLFSAHPSRSRKVHNISNSVIILDEVQALPNELLRPCMYALAELVKNYHCSVILCTATQPEFKKNNLLPDVFVTDIIPNYPELAEKMKRAESEFIGRKNVNEIAELLLSEKQALCIVNTKKHASDLYNLIRDAGDCFHLSTNMYPAHRKRVIAEIRDRLKEGKTCRVVSTQLIEAGVDIDFPVVFRSLAGVDSIVQAAGRCNREGKLSVGRVYIFEAEAEYAGFGYVKQTADITGSFKNDVNLLSPEAVSRYFRDLFDIRSDKMDKTDILLLCEHALGSVPSYPFRTISDKFRMISDDGNAVVIPVAEAKKLLARLNESNVGFIQSRISQYCVNVRVDVLNALSETGKVSIVSDSIVVMNDLSLYDSEIGFSVSQVKDDFSYII
ncbi:MAG: CRISPR-associated helicase Cas3' [Methanocorpusculum sp.]|nr:CRISPR-associated helicase Cas3' [Methanocorpusculum sp.]